MNQANPTPLHYGYAAVIALPEDPAKLYPKLSNANQLERERERERERDRDRHTERERNVQMHVCLDKS